MPIETGTYINSLNPDYPLGDDPVAQADDHLRLIKAFLKATFPNVTGPVAATHAQLGGNFVPTGGIIMWSGALNALPAGWALCNGANGTPNLQDRFIVGAGSGYGVGAQGGSVVAGTTGAGGHNHSTDAQGAHSHGGTTTATGLGIEHMPPHSHSYLLGGGNSQIGAQSYPQQGFYPGISNIETSVVGQGAPHAHGIYTDGNHGHNVSWVGDHAHQIDTRSPYYALAFIMKV